MQGHGLIPAQGTKIPHAKWPEKKKKWMWMCSDFSSIRWTQFGCFNLKSIGNYYSAFIRQRTATLESTVKIKKWFFFLMQNHQRVSVINSKLEGHSWSLWPPSACVWHPGPWDSVRSSLPFTPRWEFSRRSRRDHLRVLPESALQTAFGSPSPTSPLSPPAFVSAQVDTFPGQAQGEMFWETRSSSEGRCSEGLLSGRQRVGQSGGGVEWSCPSKCFKTSGNYFPLEEVWERMQTSSRELLDCGGLLSGGWTGRKGL